MIINLYVIDSGICIYSYDFKKNVYVDENLLSGFLTAIGTFAQQTFQTGLQSIQIQNGQKLSFFIESEQKLTFCAVADERDNNLLLEKILGELAIKFTSQFSKALSSSTRNAVDQYKNFDPILKEELKDIVKPRNKKSIISGIIGGITTLIILTIVFGSLLETFIGVLSTDFFYLIILLFFSTILTISSFTAGYIAGNPKVGLRAGFIFFFAFLIIMMMMLPPLADLFILIFPFAIIVCGATGYYGGLKRDRRKLYPLIK